MRLAGRLAGLGNSYPSSGPDRGRRLDEHAIVLRADLEDAVSVCGTSHGAGSGACLDAGPAGRVSTQQRDMPSRRTFPPAWGVVSQGSSCLRYSQASSRQFRPVDAP